MLYQYSTFGGKAILNKGDDFPLKKIGEFKTEQEAVIACKRHYEKAKKAAENFGKVIPCFVFL